MFDILREIFQTLQNNKLRTALTGFAVAWGIFMLIILLGMSKGVSNSFAQRASADNSNVVNIWGGRTSIPYKGYKEGRSIRLRNDDRTAIAHDLPHNTIAVLASKSLDSARVSTLRDYITDQVKGVFPEAVRYDNIDIVAGRFINQQDIKEQRRVMMMAEKNAEQLFGSAEAAVGQRVNAMGLSWLVIGAYKNGWGKDNYVPFSTAIALSGGNEEVSGIEVITTNIHSEADTKELQQELRASLGRQHEFSDQDNSAVWLWDRFSGYLKMQMSMNILSVAIWLIGLFTLLSGIVGVSNIMFVSVRERTHEIGIRRAIGAKPRSILIQIIAESIVITTLFGYLGVVFGMLVTQVISFVFKDAEFINNPTVDLSIALKVLVVLIVAGAIAGLFPALKATKVKPVEALREE